MVMKKGKERNEKERIDHHRRRSRGAMQLCLYEEVRNTEYERIERIKNGKRFVNEERRVRKEKETTKLTS
jgi:hypothetical protein